MNLQLAYSPCPNDTFLFYHLVHSPTLSGLQVTEDLHDVENLNHYAKQGKYDITKLSFATYFPVMKEYILLDVGSALGSAMGPILLKQPTTPFDPKNLSQTSPKPKIAVPGLYTTANLLLQLWMGKENYEPIPMRYDLVIPALITGQVPLGIIIHEERFTYKDKGLVPIQDLGEWWENETHLPIPLGAIVARRSLGTETLRKIESDLRHSLSMAYQKPPHEYILQHSQNKDRTVVQAHIDLYVNQYTQSLGSMGKQAVTELYNRALGSGYLSPEISKLGLDLFVS